MKRSVKKHSFKPTMEALESRWCPATSVSPLQNGIVTVTGDDTSNTVTITQNDNLNKLVIRTEGALSYSALLGRTVITSVWEFPSDQVTDVVINLKGGNDQLTYQLGGGSDFTNGKRITADLGSGDDVATFNFADNGTGGLALIRGALNLDTQAGAGKDQVDAFFGPTTLSDLTLTGNMGYGDDHFNAVLKAVPVPDNHLYHVPRPGTPPAINIDMEDMNDLVIRDPLNPKTILAIIPGGNDDFRVTCEAGALRAVKDNVAGTLQGADDGVALGVTLKGGDGKDNLQFQCQSQLRAGLTLLMDGQRGDDTVSADIQLSTHSYGNVNATVLGGDGNDNLTLRISNLGTGTVQGLVDGGDGFDNFNKTLNVTDQNCEIGVFF